jgi:O-antigen ligase
MTGACLLIPFLFVLATVFVMDKHLANGVVSGKYFWFYGGMGLVGLAALAISITPQLPSPCGEGSGVRTNSRFSAMDALVLCFVASVSVSALLLNDASQNTTKLTILGLLAVLYFTLNLYPSKSPLKGRLKGAIIITGLVEAIWGLLQLYGFEPSQHGIFKLTGSFFNPGPYAGYLAVVFPLALHCFLTPKSPKGDLAATKSKAPFRGLGVVGVITCTAILLVLPAAMSRASWLAVIAGSGIVLCTHYSEALKKQYQRHKKQIGMIIVPVIVLQIIALTGLYFLKKDSADGRLLTWKVSLQTVAKHPFGIGLGNFPGAYGDAQTAYFASGQGSETEEYVAGNPEYGFNEFLQIAIESGIVSLLLFLALIACAIRRMCKAEDWGRLGSFVALLVFACFSYPFSVLPFGIIFVFLVSSGGSWNVVIPKHAMTTGEKYSPLTVSLLCLLFITFCLYRQYPVYEAYKQWNKSRSYYHAGLYNEAAANYKTLYPLLNDQIQFLFEYAQCLSKATNQGMAGAVTPDLIRGRHDRLTKSNEVLLRAQQISCDPMLYNVMGKNYQALKEYAQAESALLQSTQLVPNRLYPWYLLMKLYTETGEMDKAREAAAIVQTKEPKVQSQAVKEMRREAEKLRIKN